MKKEILLSIIGGSIGATAGAVIHMTKGYIPGIEWKNTDKGTIFAFMLMGFIAAAVLTYIAVTDKEVRK